MSDFLQQIIHIFNGDQYFSDIIRGFWDAVLYVWDYKIFETADKQKVHFGNIILGIILFIFGVMVVKRLTAYLKKRLSKILPEKGALNALEKLIYYFLMIIVVIFVLDVSNVPLTVFTIVGTTLALGVGLGSQNIVNNFISGIIIMIEQPIRVGDIIEMKGIVGTITNIGARCTSIKTSKNINMLIPNSNILQDFIINWTLEDSLLKNSLELVLESNKDISEIDNILFEVFNRHEQIIKDPKPKVILQSIGRYGYSIRVDFWVDVMQSDTTSVKNDLNRMLSSVFKENNILVIDQNTTYCKNID